MAKKFRFEKRFIEFEINGHKRRVEENDELMIFGDEAGRKAQELAEKYDNADVREVIKQFHKFFKFDFYDKLFGAGAYEEDFEEQPPFQYEQEIILGILAEIKRTQNARISRAAGVDQSQLDQVRGVPQDHKKRKK
jgi:hypothetical protein